MRGLGDTEAVLAGYETHVRLQDAAPIASTLDTPDSSTEIHQADTAEEWAHGGRRAGLLAAQINDFQGGVTLAPRGTPELATTLTGSDLVILVRAVSVSEETPSIGVMLEQYQGIGITSVATHAEGAQLTELNCKDGFTTWQVTLTFPDLPLHSGQYCLSFYLFDAQGLVVYDEWKDFIHFQWISPSMTPGLVRLPHRWS